MAENPYNQNNFFTDFGAGAFGMSVSQADYLRRQSQARDRTAFQNQILQNDPRAQMAAAMWEQNIGGEFTPEGRARTRLVAGSMINSRMMNQAFGGSRLDMFSGMASGLANAGIMRVNVDGQTQQVFGPGGATNIMARQMMRQVEGRMFNEQGGARLHRTHGLTRGELGGVMGYMGTRGMLSGITGEERTYAAGTTRSQLQSQMRGSDDPFERRKIREMLGDETGAFFKEGKLMEDHKILTVDKTARQRVAKQVEDVAETLGMIKGIVGDIGQSGLLQALDSLSSGPGALGMQAAKDRLRSFRVAEMTGGGRADALMNAHVQMSQTYQQLGMSRHMSLSAADRATSSFSTSRQSNQEWVDQMAQKGFYVDNPTDSMAQTMAADTLALDGENPELATALFAIQRDRSFTEAERAEFTKRARSISRPGQSIDEMRQASANFAASVVDKTGVSMREWNRRAGGDPLSLLQQDQAQAYLDISQTEMQNRMRGQLVNDLSGTAVERQAGADLALKFSKSTLTRFVNGEMNDLADLDTRADIGEALRQAGIGDSDDQRSFVEQLVKTVGVSPKYSTLISEEERRKQAGLEIEMLKTESALGAGARSQNTIVGGFLGAENISDNIVAEALYNKGEGVEGSLLKALNSETDPIKRSKLLREAQKNGHVYTDKDGKFRQFTDEQMEGKRKELEGFQKEQRAKALGVEEDELGDIGRVSGKVSDRFDKLLANSDTKGLEAFAEAYSGGGGGAFVSKLDKKIQKKKREAESASSGGFLGWGKDEDKLEALNKEIEGLESARSKLHTEIPFDPAMAVERIVQALENISTNTSTS